MQEEHGYVVEVGQGWALVRIDRQSANGCSGCQHQKGCGVGLLGFTSGRTQKIKVPLHQSMKIDVGDHVRLSVSQPTMLKLQCLLYTVPLMAFILGASVGQVIWGERMAALMAVLSLGFSYYGVKIAINKFAWVKQCVPSLSKAYDSKD